ncbi:hypothetical protein V9T40_009100 [Parthenolecanium corni]|uniref:G-protein coupled receptors family 2 profile 2 domain-containing protein n=1 Tax=Parthenolecanium corni TaxID=536013 RepID=A0AAN9TM27_9HEMI
MLDQVPPSYRDLRIRNCMCDEKCGLFDDCCKDSNFIPRQPSKENFSCVETATNGFVYMKTACPSSWNSSTAIRENCESTNPMLLTLDVWITTPVTDLQTNITYRNMFCAFCHQVYEFDFWKLGLTCSPSANEPSQVPLHLDENILSKLHINDASPDSWIYDTPDNATYHCLYHGKVEEDTYLRYCVPSVVDSCSPNWLGSPNCSTYTSYAFVDNKVFKNPDCLACNNVSKPATCIHPSPKHLNSTLTVNILNKNIMKIPRCHEIPGNASAYEIICPTEKPAIKEITECSSNSNKCLIDGYFDISSDINFLDNVTIHVKSRDMTFNDSEYLKVNNSFIYVCGHEIPRTVLQQIYDTVDDWVSEILIKLSIVCLVLHLFFFQQLPEMKNLSGKNLAVFCFMLLIALLGFEIGPRLPRCEILAVVLHYSLLSCFTWMLIMSYDCWLSLYRATKKFRAAGGKHSNKFLIYCALSNIVPMAVVSVALYFELSPPSVIPCEHKLGYGKYKQCFIAQKFGFIVFFIIPASIMFFCNVCFFAHTAYMIFLSQRTTVNPNTRNDFKLYTRLALMMGLTWTLGTLLFVTDFILVGLLFSILNMSQGIFIFFGFTFKQKTLKQLLNKHKNNPKVSSILSTFVQENVSESATVHTQQTQLENMRP